MLRSLFGFDWRKSKAHLLLLSKFLEPHALDDFSQSEGWRTVLGESPKHAIKRFQDEGLVLVADLNAHLSYKLKVTELKEMVKTRGLVVSGRKDDLIRQLVQADPEGATKAVAGLSVLQCSERGREIAEPYLAEEKERRSRVEQQVLECLRKCKFREAGQAVASFEAEQVFQRGIGIDWRHYDPARDVAVLNTIFGSRPKILGRLDDGQLESLRLAAGMMSLWGTNLAKEWLPANLETGLTFDNDVAARMFSFLASNRASQAQYRQSNVVKYVEILAAHDSCDACKKVTKKKYKLSEVPELPNEHCTSRKGCRCTYIPITKSYREILSDK